MNQFRTSYNRIIYLTCGALILFALLVESIQLYRDRSAILNDLENSFNSYARSLNTRTRMAEGYVTGLRAMAQTKLHYVRNYSMSSPLLQYMKQIPGEDLYTLDVSHVDKHMVGNLTGVGNFEDLSTFVKEEILMALKLNSAFEMALQNNPGAVWVYYTSKNMFQNLYPWLPSSKAAYYEHVLKSAFFLNAMPSSNQRREPFWTGVYEDGLAEGSLYRKGYMVTCSAPVYGQDEFLGVVSMDISLKEYNRVMQTLVIPSGHLFLLNHQGQVLGSSEGSRLSPFALKGFLQDEALYNKIIGSLKSQRNGYQFHGDKILYIKNLTAAPWALVYLSDSHDVLSGIYWHAFQDILIIILSLTFIVGVGYVVVVRDFISPAQKLVNYIERQNKGETELPTDLPEGWQPWFDIVTKIFSENRSLLTDLENRVKKRTRQLQKKNQQLEEALIDLKQAQDQIIVQEKLASLGSLTAGIAHEIKNPLNFITNFSEVSLEFIDELDEEFPESDQRVQTLKANIRRVHEHALRADSIVKSMLAHAHGSQGVVELTDVNKLLNDAVDLACAGFRGRTPQFSLKIVKELDPELPFISLVASDVSRVFLNIINNACFAMNQKRLESARDYVARLTIRTWCENRRVCIEIRDNGIGMKKMTLSKIFNPFFSTKKAGEGTGLGMSLSYDIITKQNQGKIEVKSEYGEYSSFFISFDIQ